MVIYPYHVLRRRKKKSPTFSLLMVLLSRFRPFWVWGMTHRLFLFLFPCTLNLNWLFFVIYNGWVLNGVVAFPNNIIYSFLTFTW